MDWAMVVIEVAVYALVVVADALSKDNEKNN
jgi:hypothetical protein